LTAGRKKYQHDRVAFAVDPQNPGAVCLAQVLDVRAAGFGNPQTEQAEQRNRAKSLRLADSREAVRSASKCVWVSPSVGHTADTMVGAHTSRATR
jgi:hypothetical protein